MNENNLDKLFQKKISEKTFRASEEDWAGVSIRMTTKRVVSRRRLAILLFLLFIISGAGIHMAIKGYFTGSIDLNYSEFREDDKSGEVKNLHYNTNRSNLPNNKTNFNKRSIADTITSKGSIINPTRMNKFTVVENKKMIPILKTNERNGSATNKIFSGVLEEINNLPSQQEEQSHEQVSNLHFDITDPITSVLITSLVVDDQYIKPHSTHLSIRKRTLFELETIIGVNGADRMYGLDIYFSIFRFGRLRGYVGAGVSYRQTEGRLLASIEYPQYGFGQDIQTVNLYGNAKTLINIPFRVAYYLNKNNSLQGGLIFSRHLAGRGWSVRQSNENLVHERHWIVDTYYDDWILSAQLHYKYEWQNWGMGAGLRMERLGPTERLAERSENFTLLFEAKIIKKF